MRSVAVPRRELARRPRERWQPARFAGALRWAEPGDFNLWRFLGKLAAHRPRTARLAAGGFALALALLGAWWVYRSPLLSVEHVSVEGTKTLSPAVVEDVADLEGESIVRPDFAAARERLLAIAGVKEARISRDLLNGAHIKIVEREPWGLWQAGDQRYVIDDEGVVLAVPAPEGLPLIVQTEAGPPLAPGARVDREAVALARELLPTAERTVGRRVVALEYAGGRGLTVAFGGDLRVTFGDARDLDYKIAALYEVLKRAHEEERTVRTVDLRFGDRVAVQWGG